MTYEQIRKDFLDNPTYINSRLYQDVAVDAWMRDLISDQQLIAALREIRLRRG